MLSEEIRGVPRLIINPGFSNSWEIPLHAGINTLGRTPENDYPLEHESVSSSHCQIIVSSQGARLKDLGSTNGTFVDGQLVEEILLIPGQRLRIGNIEAQFDWDLERSESAGQPSQAAGAESEPEPQFCKFHSRTPARFVCPKCRRGLCELCVNTRQQAGGTYRFCRNCGIECIPVSVKATVRPAGPKSFIRMVAGAFGYPFKGDGMILLIAGTVVYGLLDLAGIIIGFLSLFAGGYLVAYMQRILTSSAAGDMTMPDWPDLSDFVSDILSPCLQMAGTVLACCAPAVVLALGLGAEHAWKDVAVRTAYVFGMVYFPMAFLAVAMFDSIAALNPILVLPSMVKVAREYLLVLFILGLILLAQWAKDALLAMRMPIGVRLLYIVFSSFLSLYLATVAMRVLGLLYFSKKQSLGWFRS
jgi:hypothetical protein